MSRPCLRAISNLMPPDFVGGYELGAAALLSALRREQGWEIETLCGHRRHDLVPADADPSLLGYFPLGWKNHWILPSLLQKARIGWAERAENIRQRGPERPLLLFNPRRLWIPEWIQWVNQSAGAAAYISDLWPAEYPACDLLQKVLFEGREKLPLPLSAIRSYLQSQYLSTWPDRAPLLDAIEAPIFVSEFIRCRTRHAFPGARAEAVIPWGIEAGEFPLVEGRSLETITEWGFIGRLHEEKGLHTILDLLPELRRAGHPVRLRVAGDPSTRYGQEMVRRVQGDPELSESVTFLGKVGRSEVVSQFFSKIGVLVFPSLWEEPFAITVLEALATGLPVLATNRGGTPEIINDSTGYLYDPEDPAGLREAALAILKEPEQALARGENGSERVHTDYTMAVMGRKVNDFLRDLWGISPVE